jgi:5,10-methenyltetrahydromethanopterin hydrogenase
MAFDFKTDGVKIINDGKYLIATMPNGDVIPMQVDMILQNDMSHRGFIGLTVTLKTMIPTEQFEIINKHSKE